MKLELTGTVVNVCDNGGEPGFYVEIDTDERRGNIVFDLGENEIPEFSKGRKVRVTIEGLAANSANKEEAVVC